MSLVTLKLIAALVAALVLLGGGAYAVYSYRAAIQEAVDAKATLEEMTQERDALSESLKKQKEMTDAANKLARERGLRLTEETRKAQEADDNFRTLQAKSAPDRDWAAVSVPDATRRLRRLNAGCSPEPALPCPGSEPGKDGRAPNDGHDERRSAPRSGAPENSASISQLGQNGSEAVH
jgi:hypothetical protein